MIVRSGNTSPMPTYAFGRWVLQGDWLTEDQGKGVHLPPKELAVLRTLLDAAGALVTKDSLLESVWPGCDVADESLTRCVYSLRKLLGGDKRYISTRYGKGYRFVCPVLELQESGPSAPGPSLLVLPFRGDSASFGARLHEQITRSLTKALAGTLRVMPASLTAGPLSTHDALQLVERLAPDYYLSGRCENDGAGLELFIELAHSRGHALLHSQVIRSETVETALEQVVLMVAQRMPGLQPKNESCSSYPLALAYLNGLIGLQAYTPDSLRDALQQFRQCIRLDESYVPPWSALAETWLALAILGICPAHRAFEQAQISLGRALEIEPGNPAALLRLALLTSLQGSIDAAEALFQRCLLSADRADVYGFYALHQWFCGKETQAADSIDIALKHDPESVPAQLLKLRIVAHRQPELALSMIQQAMDNGLGAHPLALGLASMFSAPADDLAAMAHQNPQTADSSVFNAQGYWRFSAPGRKAEVCLEQVAVSWPAAPCGERVTPAMTPLMTLRHARP